MSRILTTPLKVRRASNFAETGEYEVTTAQGVKRIYRDSESGGRWLITPSPDPSNFFADYLGDTKEAALKVLAERFGVP